MFVAISSAMAIVALMEGKTQSLRLLPDFSSRGTFLSLFTTIPVFMTAFAYQINGKHTEFCVELFQITGFLFASHSAKC